MIKEKQQQVKQLCTEISELCDHIKILDAEKEHSLEDELTKFVKGAMERDVNIEDTFVEDTSEQIVSFHPSMSLMSGPKLYLTVQFNLCEFKPYRLSCMIDSRC